METGKGGGHKINLVKEYIADKKDPDVLVFFDGYDTFLSESIEEITYRFMEFSERAIFSSERFATRRGVGNGTEGKKQHTGDPISVSKLRNIRCKDRRTEEDIRGAYSE